MHCRSLSLPLRFCPPSSSPLPLPSSHRQWRQRLQVTHYHYANRASGVAILLVQKVSDIISGCNAPNVVSFSCVRLQVTSSQHAWTRILVYCGHGAVQWARCVTPSHSSSTHWASYLDTSSWKMNPRDSGSGGNPIHSMPQCPTS
jgi:hypothetical protein